MSWKRGIFTFIIGATMLGWAGFYDAEGNVVAQTLVRGFVYAGIYRALGMFAELLAVITERWHR